MTKCQFCHKGLNSSYIRTTSKGRLTKIGYFCSDCELYFDSNQRVYTVNEKLYTVFNNDQVIDHIAKFSDSEIIVNNDSVSNNNYTNPKLSIKISQVARPRFELGSKAPKASMLGHYTRH